MVKTLYDILEPLEESLQIVHKHGGRVSCELLRDIQIYRDFNAMEGNKMQRYSDLSEKYSVSESIIRDTVRSMRMVINEK